MRLMPGIAVLFMLACLTGSAPGQEKLNLRLHLKKGDAHRINVALDQTIQQDVQGLKQRQQQSITIVYTFTVEDVDAQGAAVIAVKYESVAFHAKTPGGNIDYDSANPPAQVPAMAGGFAGLVGQGYTMTIRPDGQVSEVKGLDKLLAAVLSKMNVPEGPARAAAERALRQQINEQNMKANLQNVFAPYPDHPVAIGESWGRKTEISMGFPLVIESTYTLKSREGGMALIEVNGKASSPPDAPPVDLGQMKMSYRLAGNQDGSIRIVESTGWTQTAEMSQKLGGDAKIRVPNQPEQSVPVALDSRMQMKTQ
jgi:hypothetical protein